MGQTYSGIFEIISYNNFSIIHKVIDYFSNPDTCNEAISFLSDCILVIPNEPAYTDIRSRLTELLSHYEKLLNSLILSTSKLTQHTVLKLLHNLLIYGFNTVAQPHLITCLEIFFNSPRNNVLHHTITQVLSATYSHSTLWLFLMKEGRLSERILDAFDKKDQSKEYYAHLLIIAKWIEERDLFEDNSLIKNERWKKFYQTEITSKSSLQTKLLPPNAELRHLKERQVTRGAKMVFSLPNSTRGIGQGREAFVG